MIPDTVLLPAIYKDESKRKRRAKKGGLTKFMFLILLVLVISLALFSFSDIGGNIVLSIAKNSLAKNFNIALNAEKITGNPVIGYTLHNFTIADMINSNDIFSARSLSVKLNIPSTLTGNLRLSEISLGGVSMDVEKFIASVKEMKFPEIPQKSSNNFGVASAFADESEAESLPEIPIDKLALRDSRLTWKFIEFDVDEVAADVPGLNIDVDGRVNGLPLTGKIDMGESAGLTAVNVAELSLGSGKLLATGGLNDGKLDLHISAENLNLKEMTALYPSVLSSRDFDGTSDFTADLTGDLDNPKFSGLIDYKGSKIYGYPVERASANLSYSDNRVSVGNLQAIVFNVPLRGELAAAMRPGQPLSVMIKLDGSEASLNDLDKILGIPELKALNGKVSVFSVNVSGPVDSLNGLVNFNAPRIAYDGRALSNIRVQMKLAKSDTANVNGKFTFEGASGYLSGSVASILKNPLMNLTAKIADLDVKRIESMIPDAPSYKLAGKITASVNVKGTASKPQVTGSINSPEFSGWGQKIVKPAVNFAFDGKTLTISKTEGTLNGMPVNLSGTISPLPSKNPALNINATISMSPSALKQYVPDIAQYDLKGNINAGLKVQGTADNPAVRLLATSPNLEAMKMIKAKDLELTTALDGDLTKLEKISVKVSAKSVTASGLAFTGLNADISKNGDSVALSNFTARSGEGAITGKGAASVSGKSPLDFSFDFKELALASLAKSSGIDMTGKLTGTLRISGKNSNPSLNFTASVPSLSAAGFAVKNLKADIAGDMSNITLKDVRADVEGNEIKAAGNVQITPALKVNVSVNGSNINLASFLKDPAMKSKISGAAGLSFNITGSDKGITGKGSLTSQALNAFGIKMTNVNLPLSYSGSDFSSKGGTAKLYNGSAKNNLTFNTSTMKFTDEIEASGVDVNGLLQDVSGGLEGKITGTGKLTFKINGSAGDKVSYSGNGNFSMGQGAITGFTWLDLFTKIHKSDGLRYSSVNAPLALQTGKLTVKAGAIANAVKNDALYKYAKLIQNGVIDFSGKKITMNFLTESSVNYQLINAIQSGTKGGIQSLLKGGVSGFEDNVKAFLTGGLSEAKKSASTGDFRTITLRIHGNVDSLSFSDLKIGESTLKPQETKTETQEQAKPKDIKEAVKERLNEKLKEVLPDSVKKTLKNDTPSKSTQTQTQSQTQTQTQPQSTRQKIEDRVKEELQKGIQKGLGELFRR